MPMIEFESNNESVLPEGVYTLTITEVEQTTSSKGNPQLRIGVRTVDGPVVDRARSIWYSLLDTAGWRLARLLDACEVPYEQNGKAIRFDTDDLIDRTFVCDVKVGRSNTGKERNEFENERAEVRTAQARPAPAPAQAASVATMQGESVSVQRRRGAR